MIAVDLAYPLLSDLQLRDSAGFTPTPILLAYIRMRHVRRIAGALFGLASHSIYIGNIGVGVTPDFLCNNRVGLVRCCECKRTVEEGQGLTSMLV